MKYRTSFLVSVEQTFPSVRVSHTLDRSWILICWAAMGGLLFMLTLGFGKPYLGAVLAIPVLVAGLDHWWSDDPKAWRQRQLSNHDLEKLSRFLSLVRQHEIAIDPLPCASAQLTNGQLEHWCEKVDVQLKVHRRQCAEKQVDTFSQALHKEGSHAG